jgi:hypothetical protein
MLFCYSQVLIVVTWGPAPARMSPRARTAMRTDSSWSSREMFRAELRASVVVAGMAKEKEEEEEG